MTLDRELAVEIATHVVRNLWVDKDKPTGGNLILAIQSPPGEGKTYQCKVVLGEVEVQIVRFPIADLESPGAGLPAVRLVECYLGASDAIEGGRPSVLIIEDADLGIGQADEAGEITQFTMNRSLVTGTLMSLCDAPTLVDVPSESVLSARGKQKLCRRVPIIMTGNNLRRVYPALFRDGRARVLDWRASDETKISYLMSEVLDLHLHEASSLVEEFGGFPISFWDSVLESLRHRQMSAAVRDRFERDDASSLSDLGDSWTKRPPASPKVHEVREAALSHRALRERWGA